MLVGPSVLPSPTETLSGPIPRRLVSFRHVPSQGVFSALQQLLTSVRCTLTPEGHLAIPQLGTVDMVRCCSALLKLLLQHQWCEVVTDEVGERFGVSGGHTLAPSLVAKMYPALSPMQQSFLRKIQTGTFYAGEHTCHWAQTELCRHCGQPDGIEHRLAECIATSSARSSLPPGWKEWPKHLRHFLLPIIPSEAKQLAALRHTQEVLPVLHAPPSQAQRIALFTDGSATGERYVFLRRASWGVVLATDWAFTTVAAGRLPGCLQSAARAEVFALWQAVQWAQVYDCTVEIWSDCAVALRRMQSLLDGSRPDPTWANRDLWYWVACPEFLSRVGSLHKVHSHQGPQAAVEDRWAQEGNAAADHAAAAALLQWFPREASLGRQLREFLEEQEQRIKVLVQLHMSTAALYTEGDTRTNRPLGPDALQVPRDVVTSLPPSLQRHGSLRRGGLTLPALWQRLKRGAAEPEEAPPPRRRRLGGARERARDGLRLVPQHLPLDDDSVCAWRELAGLEVAQESFPFFARGWHTDSVARWLTWLELTICYALVMHNPPPLWHGPPRGWSAWRDRQRVRPASDTVYDYTQSLRGLIGPLLVRWGWPVAPAGLRSESPVLLTVFPLIAWRLSSELYNEVTRWLFSWYPHGIKTIQDLRIQKPWPRTDRPSLADGSQLLLGRAADQPLKKQRITR